MAEKRVLRIFFEFVIFLIFMVISINSISAATRTCYSCNNCTAEIGNSTSGDIVQLNNSISDFSGTCIDFAGKDNITFSCQNFSNFIDGDDTGADYGIYLSDTNGGGNNNIIRNCNISDFYIGLFLPSSSDNNNLTNLNIYSNSFYAGISIGSNNNTLKNIKSDSNNPYGIFLGGSNNTLVNITSISNAFGVFFSGTNNVIINSSLNDGYDVYIQASTPSSCNNKLVNVNGTGNKPVIYYNYSVNLQDWNSNISELILCNADNSIINNLTLTNLTSAQRNLFYILSSENVSITNTRVEGLQEGFYIYHSSNNRFINVTSKNNNYGIRSYYGNNNTFDNVTSNNNSYGFFIEYSQNNTFFNTISNSNQQYGTYLYTTNLNNTFTNITSNLNQYGITVQNSNNNTFTNIKARNNSQYGIYFIGASSYNTIRDSFIEYNTQYGVYFQQSGGYPQYNLMYNNYFNNTAQYYNATNVTNFFNTTKTPAINIVGGSYIGGNYWAALNGTGFSQTCTSSTDGICDTAFSLDGLNYDYLPLTCIESWSCSAWGICSGSTQARICTDANFCQTYKYKPAESQACTSGGGGTSTTTSTTSASLIPAGEPATMTITNPNIEVGSVTISTTENVSNVVVTVTEVPRARVADFEIGISTRVIYQALNISVSGLNNSQIANATVQFRVNISWVEEQKKSTFEDILLFRKNETGIWGALSTTYLSNDSQYYYYSAVTPGFSTFVIFFGRYECEPGITRCFESQIQMCLGNATWLVTERCSYGCDEQGKCVKTAPFKFDLKILYFVIGIIITGLIVVFLLRRIPVGKNKSSREVRSSLRHKQSFHRQR